MASLDILYVILGVCVVVITVTVVWLANELIGLIRSLKRSAQDTEVVTKEIREKVLLVSEALDRAGTAATSIIGLIEDSIEKIKEKRDQIVGSIGLLTGAGEYIKQRKETKSEKVKTEKPEPEKEKEKPEKEEKDSGKPVLEERKGEKAEETAPKSEGENG